MNRTVLIILGLTFIISACNPSTGENESRQKSPEELRMELLVQEQSTPETYLKHRGTWRENLMGKTVLEGTISNSAALANFKDVLLNVTWLTKTKTELKTEQYVIYEYVKAGKSISYKIKVNAPSATGGVSIGINSATPVN